MEFDFSIEHILGEKLAVLSSEELKRSRFSSQIEQMIDKLGQASAEAQELPTIITTTKKLLDNPNQRIYLACEGCTAIGFLKVGTKKLFIHRESSTIHEIEPLCVLDFYVVERQQRSGFGKSIFEFMLNNERTQPHQLAYDRPSPKLIAFLAKHYHLCNYIPQTNNYVVFNEYFGTANSDEPKFSSSNWSLSTKHVSSTASHSYGKSADADTKSRLFGNSQIDKKNEIARLGSVKLEEKPNAEGKSTNFARSNPNSSRKARHNPGLSHTPLW